MWFNIFRKKTSIDYILQIINITKKCEKDKRNISKMLRFLDSLDKKMINLIDEEFETKEFQNEYDTLKKMISDLKELKTFEDHTPSIKKILDFEMIFHEKILKKFHEFDDLILGKELKRGGEGVIFLIENNENWVIKIFGNKNRLAVMKSLMIRQKYLEGKINIPRILKVGYHQGKPSIVMERVKGFDLHCHIESDWHKLLKIYEVIPQWQYDKLISDYKELSSKGFTFEIKPANFMYNSNQGFFFVDVDTPSTFVGKVLMNDTEKMRRLNKYEPQFGSIFIPSMIRIYLKEKGIEETDRLKLINVLKKLKTAGLSLNNINLENLKIRREEL